MMLNPTDEQLQFKAEVRRFLDRACPVSTTRSTVESGLTHDKAAWAGLARLGAVGLLVPASQGGSGAGIVEAAFVCEELGRLVVASPYLSSAVLAAGLLVGLDDGSAMADYLPGIASGDTVATVALLDGHGRWDPAGVRVRAEQSGAGWLLHGGVAFVTDAVAAGLLLVVARTGTGLGVFVVEVGDAGMRVAPLECLDQTQPLSRLELDGAVGRRIGADADVAAVLDRVMGEVIACLVSAQVGGAERCLEMSAEYARIRVQFGRPIGAYQAIKHRCADMFIRVQCARSAVHHLLEALRTGASEAAVAVSVAKAYGSDAYLACAADTIQIHGGIGFTWEHDAHLYFKRAKASAHLFGDPVHHRGVLARLLVG